MSAAACCRVCGRVLSSPGSRAAGVGPVCAAATQPRTRPRLLFDDAARPATAPPRRRPPRPVRTLPDLSTWTGTPAGQLTLWRTP